MDKKMTHQQYEKKKEALHTQLEELDELFINLNKEFGVGTEAIYTNHAGKKEVIRCVGHKIWIGTVKPIWRRVRKDGDVSSAGEVYIGYRDTTEITKKL